MPDARDLYVICALGKEGSETRTRADEICDLLVIPIAKDFGLTVRRSDRDPTPGHITTQILQGILSAEVVVADLTGQNPNVFYELAFAHAFGRPVIMLADTADTLPFDTRNERVIAIGDTGAPISFKQGEAAKKGLKAALDTVLSKAYQPQSLIRDVAGVASLASLAPENPMATELAAVKSMVESIDLALRRPSPSVDSSLRAENKAMLGLIDVLLERGHVSDEDLETLITETTSQRFDWTIRDMLSSSPHVE